MSCSWLPAALSLGCVIGLAGCAVTDVAPRTAGTRPAQDTDEAGFWQVMDEAEQELKTSALVDRSPEINAWAEELVCELAGSYCGEIRVYIVNRPYFNANMAPNGAMQIWSGLLLRAENEAQVAFVISHEIAHYVQRHSLEQWRTAKNASNAALVVSIGAAAGGLPGIGEIANIAALSTMYGFSREQETEADANGFERMTDAGYAGREAAAIWRYLVEEVEHSDFESKRERQAHASIFDTHPLTAERIASLERMANGDGEDAKVGRESYRELVSPYLDEWLRADLRRKDFGETLYLIDRLLGYGRELGTLHYYRGEAYRLRRDEGDIQLAQRAYEKAITYADTPAKAWRELGQAYWRAGEAERAKEAFTAYLDRRPEAKDRLLIKGYIGKLDEGIAP